MKEEPSKVASGPLSEPRTTEYLILHGLVDLVKDTNIILANAKSKSLLRDAYRDSTTSDERRELAKLVENADRVTQPRDIDLTFVSTIVNSIVQTMARQDTKVTLLHDVKTNLVNPGIAIYNIIKTKKPGSLTRIDLSPKVYHWVERGVAHAMNGEYYLASKKFEQAIRISSTENDAFVTRILAAWSCHWMGEDNRALNYVDEVKELQYDDWSTQLINYVAEHPTPDLFRDGPLMIQGFFRILATVPTSGELLAFKGTPNDEDGINWKSLEGDMDYMPIDEFERDMSLRIKLSGNVGSLPSLHGYYLGFGVVDGVHEDPQRVLYQPITGPETIDAIETIRFNSE